MLTTAIKGMGNGWLGILFGSFYAKWCVMKMIRDTSNHFQGHGTQRWSEGSPATPVI